MHAPDPCRAAVNDTGPSRAKPALIVRAQIAPPHELTQRQAQQPGQQSQVSDGTKTGHDPPPVLRQVDLDQRVPGSPSCTGSARHERRAGLPADGHRKPWRRPSRLRRGHDIRLLQPAHPRPAATLGRGRGCVGLAVALAAGVVVALSPFRRWIRAERRPYEVEMEFSDEAMAAIENVRLRGPG